MMDSFFNQTYCKRCGAPLKDGRIMSMFNTDCICINCSNKEQQRADYREANLAVRNAEKNGNRNFEGIGLREHTKPILFKPELITLIEKGLKTETRRSLLQPKLRAGEDGVYEKFDDGYSFEMRISNFNNVYDHPIKLKYAVGDVLYVQEAFKIFKVDDENFKMYINFRDNSLSEVCFSPTRYEKFKKFYGKHGWQSPYFMPREAARLFLTIEETRIHRIQEITNDEIRAEGIVNVCDSCNCKNSFSECDCCPNAEVDIRSEFSELWDSTLTQEQLGMLSYEANPFVAAYRFVPLINQKCGGVQFDEIHT